MSEAGTQQNADEGAPAVAGRSFVDRFVGAFRLDRSVYEEIANDPGALAQAAGVAACVAVARTVGVSSTATSGEAVFGAIYVFGFWPLVSVLVWLVGKLLRNSGELGPVLRVVGFAMAPLILVGLLLVPNEWFRGGVLLVTYALLFGSLLVGVRQVLRIDTGRAAFVCIVVAMLYFFLHSIMVYTVLGGGSS
jgi:hypothetical protein